MLSTILIVLLVLMILGALPNWNHSRDWGPYPSGGLGLVLIVLVILALTHRI
jgi:hypothetical protein